MSTQNTLIVSSTGTELYYMVYNGQNWSAQQLIPGAWCSGNASVVYFNQQVYCFYQGPGNNGQLMCSVYTPAGNYWNNPYQVGNTGISESPSAVVYMNSICVFHQGENNSQTLWCNSLDNFGSWTGDTQIANTDLSGSPSAVVYENMIYVFHQGRNNSGILWLNIGDGDNFQGDSSNFFPMAPTNTVSIQGNPFAVINNGVLSCYYNDNNAMTGIQWVPFGTSMAWEGIPPVVNETAYLHVTFPPLPGNQWSAVQY